MLKPVEHIGLLKLQGHAAFLRQLTGFFQRYRRHIDRMHKCALFGQSHVRRGAENVGVGGIPLVPEG